MDLEQKEVITDCCRPNQSQAGSRLTRFSKNSRIETFLLHEKFHLTKNENIVRKKYILLDVILWILNIKKMILKLKRLPKIKKSSEKTSLLRNDENRSKNCKIFPLIFRFYVKSILICSRWTVGRGHMKSEHTETVTEAQATRHWRKTRSLSKETLLKIQGYEIVRIGNVTLQVTIFQSTIW